MKQLRAYGTLLALFLVLMTARAQETLVFFQAGSSNVTSTYNLKSSGYRVALAVELMPTKETLTLGALVGYQMLDGTQQLDSFRMSTVSFSVVSRYMFGWQKLKGFVRLGLGAQSSTQNYQDPMLTHRETRFGMIVDTSGGVMYRVGRKTFFAADYSWLWLTGSFENMDIIGVASLSIGFRL